MATALLEVLILTYWNVNMLLLMRFQVLQYVLILTYWNVNKNE